MVVEVDDARRSAPVSIDKASPIDTSRRLPYLTMCYLILTRSKLQNVS